MSADRSNSSRVTPPEPTFSIVEVALAVRAHVFVAAIVIVVFAVSSVFVAISLPDTYRAKAVLAPNDESGTSTLASLSAQYGNLASLAGINFGSSSSNKVEFGLEVLQSQLFLSSFVDRHEILVPLLAAKGWERETRRLIIDESIYDLAAEEWVRNPSEAGNIVPSSQEAYRAMSDVLSVVQDRQSGFVTITVLHYSPDLAAQWVNWLIRDINNEILNQDVREAQNNVAFLEAKLDETTLIPLQSVFFQMLEEQIKVLMLAQSTDQYLLRVIDPALAPEVRAAPNRALIAVLGTLFGVAISVVLALLLFRTENRVV